MSSPSTFTPLTDEIPCSFCSGHFTAGQNDNGAGAIVHSMPPCKKFKRLTPDRFLEAARLAKKN